MALSARDMRMVLHGMTLARSALIQFGVEDLALNGYQTKIAESWPNLEGYGLGFEAEINQVIEEVNEAIVAKDPTWGSSLTK